MNMASAPPAIRFRHVRWVIATALVVSLAFAAMRAWMRDYQTVQYALRNPEHHVYQLLHSETLSFLVTERLTSQIIVEIDNSSILLGTSSGTLTGVVRMYYGVDLSRLRPETVRMEGGTCMIDLPDPEVLDFSVDVASLQFRTRRSLIRVIGDRLTSYELRSDLQNRFRSASDRFFREQSLLPDRAALCARLNQHTQSWADRLGVPVSFR